MNFQKTSQIFVVIIMTQLMTDEKGHRFVNRVKKKKSDVPSSSKPVSKDIENLE